MRAAIVTWDGGSNRQPFEVLCRGLVDRGDQVHALSHDAHRGLYAALGAEFDVLPVGEKLPGWRPSADDERERVMGVWLSLDVAEAVVAMLNAVQFDVVLVDASLVAAFAACEASNLPYVVVHHSLPGAAWSGPRREQFEAFVEPVNHVRRSLGVPSVADFGELLSTAAAHIAPTARMLDREPPWDVCVHYVGPLQPAGVDADIGTLPSRFVLVSFSTTWQRQVDALQAVIDALAALDRPVVVTTGPSLDPSELRPAPNTSVFSELPHHLILDSVEVVVTHAGHGTVLAALAAGVPVVAVPMGRDQHDVAGQVDTVGAGVQVEAKRVGSDLLNAVERVLADRRFAERAAEIRESIAGHGGLAEALAIIDRSASNDRQRTRP